MPFAGLDTKFIFCFQEPEAETKHEIHDDEDFEKALMNLDAKQPAKKVKNIFTVSQMRSSLHFPKVTRIMAASQYISSAPTAQNI